MTTLVYILLVVLVMVYYAYALEAERHRVTRKARRELVDRVETEAKRRRLYTESWKTAASRRAGDIVHHPDGRTEFILHHN